MIPYFEQPSLHLFGPFTIHAFGVLVVTGILTGNVWLTKRAKLAKWPEKLISALPTYVVAYGLIGSHILEVLFYHPERLIEEGPIVLIQFWKGMSSFGGFLSGTLGFFMCMRKYKPKLPKLHYADVVAEGLLIGFTIGRIGCTIAHDHIGRTTEFFLAFIYPDGPRHNLGFEEFIYLACVVIPAILWINRRKFFSGVSMVMIILLYTPVRFFLDFLRNTDRLESDVRYLGLTPAQYAAIGVFITGIYFLHQLRLQARASNQLLIGPALPPDQRPL